MKLFTGTKTLFKSSSWALLSVAAMAGVGLIPTAANATSGLLKSASECVSSVGREDCFAVGDNHQIYQISLTQNGWGNWQSLGGYATSMPSCLSRHENHLECFTKGTDNALWHNYWLGQNWSGWHSLGGNIKSDPECWTREQNHMECSAQGGDNALHTRAWTAQNGWQDWQNLGGIIIGKPACVSWNANHQDCYVKDAGNGLHHKWWFAGQGWSHWQGLGGEMLGSPECISRFDGHIQCFTVGTDQALNSIEFNGHWRNWYSLGGQLNSQVDCITRDSNNMECFALDSNNHLHSKQWQAGSDWSDWQWQHGTFSSGISCLTASSNHAECFGLGTNGNFYRNHQFTGSNWAGWTDMHKPTPLKTIYGIDDIPQDQKTKINGVDFAWSSAGPIPDMHCTRITEASEPAHTTWSDNYFCTSTDIDLQWSSAGAIADRKCTQIEEIADPHTWADNYLCLPSQSPFAFKWHSAGQHASASVRWFEGADLEGTWADNYLTIGTSGDPMITLSQMVAPLGGHYAAEFAGLSGVMQADIFIDNPGNIHGPEIAKAHGLLRTDNIQGNSLFAQALRTVTEFGGSLGMPRPTPFTITLTRSPIGVLNIAFDIRVLDVWTDVPLPTVIGTEAKFKTLNLIFHAKSGKAQPSYPIQAIGQGFIKPSGSDNWLAVKPIVTLNDIAQRKITLGGEIIGSCGNTTPNSATQANHCNQTWDLLNKDIVEADSINQGNGNFKLGSLFVTYTNGQYTAVKGDLQRARINGTGGLTNFQGEANIDVSNAHTWTVAGSANYGSSAYAVSGTVSTNGVYQFSASRSVDMFAARGTTTINFGNQGLSTTFEGQMCFRTIPVSCGPFDFICNPISYTYCSPSTSMDVGSNGQACMNVLGLQTVCANVL